MTKRDTIKGVCGKCEGRGRVDAFSHYCNGVCFWCEGTGVLEIPVSHEAYKAPERVFILALKVDGEVFEVYSNQGPRAFEVQVRAPERGDSWEDTAIGCIWFLDGGAEASDGMRIEGRSLSNEGKRALFAAAREVSRAAEREGR